MRIVISGTPGSGKSTAAKLVAKALKLKHHSMGDLQRSYAKERQISIGDLMKIEEHYPLIDRELDGMQQQLGKNEDDFIIDGRFSAYFIPHATLKVFLDADPIVRAERIWKDRRADENAKTPKELLKKMEVRQASDEKRCKQLYDVSYQDPKLYHHVLDTSKLKPADVVKQIVGWAKEISE